MPAWLTDFQGIAAVISAVAALIAARNANKAKQELKPNHGSSTRDVINRVDRNIRSLEDQINDIRRSSNIMHDDLLTRLHDLEATARKKHD